MLGLTNLDSGRDLSDEEVLKKSTGQPWLFSILLDRYEKPFTRKVMGILRDRCDAEEVVQDAFTKIYVHADSFTPQEGAKFSSWAYRILMNTAFTKKEHSGFDEKRDGVERVLVRLPEHFSYVLRLHYLERWSHEDISKTTNENVGTIKARIHRAKEAFRRESKDDEVEIFL